MLLDCGVTVVWPEWFVTENKPCGFCRVYYVEGGSVRCFSGTESFPLRPNTLYLFSSAAPYRLEQDPADPLRCTFLHLDLLPRVLRRCIEIPIAQESTLFFLISAIRSAINGGTIRSAAALAEALTEHLAEKDLLPGCESALAPALLALSANLNETPNISALAALCGYSVQHFIRRFRLEFGMPPHQFIILCRMRAAARMLSRGDSVAQTAASCGYSDPKLFSRAFIRFYQVPPSRYRQYYPPMP
ncbi:MAG: helix-turn-helix domain-containing protein [Acutalibacteraceae bacterium]|jgi:AraC-like DNA-binding protein